MKLGLIFAMAVPACLVTLATIELGCASGSDYSPIIETCEAGTDAAPPKELVCASNFCGTIADKVTGATANCGACTGYSQCGDNGVANVCGSSCMPYVTSDGDGGTQLFTNACLVYFGGDPEWTQGFGVGMQFPPSCSYMDPNNCLPIYNDPSQGPCAGDVCGAFYCCVSNPDAGINPLLPGAVAGGDGGLP